MTTILNPPKRTFWLRRHAHFTYGVFLGNRKPDNRRTGRYVCAGFVHSVLGIKLAVGETRRVTLGREVG